MKEETVFLSEFDDEAIFCEASKRLHDRYEEETGEPFTYGRIVLVYVGGDLEAIEEESGVVLFQT